MKERERNDFYTLFIGYNMRSLIYFNLIQEKEKKKRFTVKICLMIKYHQKSPLIHYRCHE